MQLIGARGARSLEATMATKWASFVLPKCKSENGMNQLYSIGFVC